MPKFYLNRRALLIGITSAIAGSALAGGDGGGGFNKNPNVKNKYSQREFAKLSFNEINQIYYNYTQNRRTHIVGFSRNMSDIIVSMTNAKRRRAQRLIREMNEITDKAKRLKRLRREMESIDSELSKLIASRKRAIDKGRRNAVKETDKQITILQRYRDGVRTWVRFPHEGTR